MKVPPKSIRAKLAIAIRYRSGTGSQSAEQQRAAKPPQFSLSTLMWIILGICVLLASVQWVGGYATIWLIVMLLAVAAHVAGNAIGTRLRASSRAGSLNEDDDPSHPLWRGKRVAGRDDFAPASQLSKRHSLGKWMIIVPLLGFLIAGFAGGYYLAASNWEQATLMGVACGFLASGVLGAVGGFLVGSFLQVTLSALWQASQESKSR